MPRDTAIQTVILCAARTRLREYTETIPKVLVEVGGRPHPVAHHEELCPLWLR